MAQQGPESANVAAQAFADANKAWMQRTPGRARIKHFLPKRYRKKTHQWLCALDAGISFMLGKPGLQRFIVPTEDLDAGANPYAWPSVWVATDRAPDAVAGMSFLRWQLRANVWPDWDPSHGAFRAALEGITAAGLMVHLSLMTLAYNCGYGEWKDGARHEQIKESVKDSVQTMSGAQDIIFQNLLLRLARERGIDPVDLSTQRVEELHDSLLEDSCWARALPKLTTNKFFGVYDRYRDHERLAWTERLYGLWSCAADLDALPGSAGKNAAGAAAAAHEAASSAAGAKREARQIRGAAKNPIQHAFNMYADVENKIKQDIINVVLAPLRRWHSAQSKLLRSTPAAKDWEYAMCNGGFMQHLVDMVKVLDSFDVLGGAGVDVSDTAVDDVGSCQLSFEDAYCTYVGDLCLATVHAHARWGLEYVLGWPRRSVLLLGPPPVREAAREELREQLVCVTRAKACGDASLATSAERSHLNLTPVLQLAAMLSSEPGEGPLSERFSTFLTRRHSRLRATQLLEDGFNAQKQTARKCPTRRIADENAYFTLLDKSVSDVKHRFRRPLLESVVPVTNATLPDDAFHPCLKDAWKELATVVSHQETPPWHHPGANSQHATLGDIVWMRAAFAAPAVPSFTLAKLCSYLLVGNRMAVRKTGTDAWLYVCGRIGDAVFLGWPLQRKTLTSVAAADGSVTELESFCFATDASALSLQAVVMFHYNDWEAIELTWRSPMWQRQEVPACPDTMGLRQRARCFKTCQPRPLLTFAASKAFWRLGKTFCQALCQELEIPVAGTDDFFHILWQLCHKILQCSEDELMGVLKQRNFVDTHAMNLQALGEMDGLRDDLSKDERKMYDNLVQDITSGNNDVELLKKSWVSKKAELVERAAAKAKPKAKARGRGGRGAAPPVLDPLAEYRNLRYVPEDAMTQAELKRYCPPDGRVWNAWKQERWAGSYKHTARTSYPWSRGHGDAAWHVVKQLWAWYLEDWSLPTSACPIEGLF